MKEIKGWRENGNKFTPHSPTRSYDTVESVNKEVIGIVRGPVRLETSNIQMNSTATGIEDDCNIIDTPIFKNTMEYLSD